MRLLARLGSLLFLATAAPALFLGSSACQNQCAALISCSSGERQVTECPQGKTCREVVGCGQDILCEENACVPACPVGTTAVDSCPTGATCDYTRDCNADLLCAPASCTKSDVCGPDRYCSFADGRCGNGAAGQCLPRPKVCSDGPSSCFCDGTISGLNGLPCAGLQGVDLDATGKACTPPASAISCGELVCDGGTSDYCQITPSDTGGRPSAACAVASCDPATCACLGAVTQACNGTCVDGPNGPTITCPGG